VRDLPADLSGLQRAVGFRVQEATLSCVTGIGSLPGAGCSVGACGRLRRGPSAEAKHELAGACRQVWMTIC